MHQHLILHTRHLPCIPPYIPGVTHQRPPSPNPTLSPSPHHSHDLSPALNSSHCPARLRACKSINVDALVVVHSVDTGSEFGGEAPRAAVVTQLLGEAAGEALLSEGEEADPVEQLPGRVEGGAVGLRRCGT